MLPPATGGGGAVSLVTADSSNKVSSIKAFTLAEALVMLLVSSLIIVATLPVITKKNRMLLRYKKGPREGWTCLRSKMPCTFNPPVHTGNYVFFYNDDEIPAFAAVKMRTITIVSTCGSNTPELYKTMDSYKNGKLTLSGTYCSGADKVQILF